MELSDQWLQQLRRLADAVERLAGPAPTPPDWQSAQAFAWRGDGSGHLRALPRAAPVAWDDLLEIENQKQRLRLNTEQFVRGLPANHALLWGARGTGKSSLVKALLAEFAERGLRLVDVERERLQDLPAIAALLNGRPERFLVFCDDLSFEEGESGYKRLKAVLDGSLRAQADNVLIYATSNRRHLMPERMGENLDAQWVDAEIHPGDTTEEKLSLSERFGLSLGFHPFSQEQYLRVAAHWLQRLGMDREPDEWRAEALRWALQRGSRNGRTAAQFARDWVGRWSLERPRQDTVSPPPPPGGD